MQLFFSTVNKLFWILLTIVTLFKLLIRFYRCKIKKKFKVLLAQYKTQAIISSMKVSSYWKMLIAISNPSDYKHYFAFNKANLNKINSIYFEMDMKEVQRKMIEENQSN